MNMRNKSMKRKGSRMNFSTGDLIGDANRIYEEGQNALKKRFRRGGQGKFLDL